MLGPEGNGQYALAILLPNLLAQALNLGVAPANAFHIGRSKDRTETAVAATLVLWGLLTLAGLGAAVAIIALGGEWLFPGVATQFLVLAALTYPVILLKQFLLSIIQGREKFRGYNLVRICVPVTTLVSAIVLVWLLRLDVLGALSAFLIGQASGTLVALGVLHSHFSLRLDREVRSYAHSAVSYGWKVHGANVTMFVNYRLDLFLVNFFLGTTAAGVYTVAIQIAERLWVLSDVTSTVLLPKLSSLHDDERRRRWLTPTVGRWVGYAGILMALIVAAIVDPAVGLVFGEEYRDAAEAVLWFLPGIVVMNFARILASDIAARGRPEFNAFAALATLAANAALTLVLIPSLGTNGAAMATSLAYSVSLAYTLLFFVRLSGIRPMEPFLLKREDWQLLKALVASRNRLGDG